MLRLMVCCHVDGQYSVGHLHVESIPTDSLIYIVALYIHHTLQLQGVKSNYIKCQECQYPK